MTRYLSNSVVEGTRKVQALRERLKSVEDMREARSLTLLREWLSTEQQAQFDASNPSKLSALTAGSAIASSTAQQPISRNSTMPANRSWGGVLFHQGTWSQGDVMLAQKIALETDEMAALKIAKGFAVRGPEINTASALIRRTY